jgi:DNA repair protein RecO (recombination protein O)
VEWRDEGVVLGIRRHGESAAIAEVLTAEHGYCSGLVRGGRSRQQRPVLQPGNRVAITWRARLEDHLGNFTVEPLQLSAGTLMESSFRLAGLSTLVALVQVLPEREPHPRLYAAFRIVLAAMEEDAVWPALLARFELGLLEELGFGLDLARCAATGTQDDLAYVSPRTGRAVSRAAGLPYHNKLLQLPGFLRGELTDKASEIGSGFRLTGYFLNRHVFEPRGVPMPQARETVLAGLDQWAH